MAWSCPPRISQLSIFEVRGGGVSGFAWGSGPARLSAGRLGTRLDDPVGAAIGVWIAVVAGRPVDGGKAPGSEVREPALTQSFYVLELAVSRSKALAIFIEVNR